MSDLVPQPEGPHQLRASNADRERVASVLNQAMAEGRLSIPELEERLDAVYGSKTLGELEPLTRDLPGHQVAVPRMATPVVPQAVPASAAPQVGGTAASSVAIAIMSGTTRKGPWVMPERLHAVAIMGGIDLDLTECQFAAREVTIVAVAIMGGVDIVVPEGVTVVVDGLGLMGGFDDRAVQQAPPGSPVVRVVGAAIMGGVDVRRAEPSRRKRQLPQ